MNWEFNSIRIFVNKYEGSGKQIMPLLQPLSGGTVVQFYGYETDVRSISGLIVGESDLTSLRALKNTATAYVLNSPEGTLGNYYLKAIKWDRLPTIYQTIRTDLDCEAPVYSVSLELQES